MIWPAAVILYRKTSRSLLCQDLHLTLPAVEFQPETTLAGDEVQRIIGRLRTVYATMAPAQLVPQAVLAGHHGFARVILGLVQPVLNVRRPEILIYGFVRFVGDVSQIFGSLE